MPETKPQLICLICYRRSEPNDEDESPETKAERERVRRQANNARERYADHRTMSYHPPCTVHTMCKDHPPCTVHTMCKDLIFIIMYIQSSSSHDV